MKRKDMIMVGVVALVAAFFAYLIAGAMFGSPKKNPLSVPIVIPISQNLPDTSSNSAYKSIYNAQALDPTQLIRVGGQTNNQPFTTGQ